MSVHKLVPVNTSQTVHLKGKYNSIPSFLYTCRAAADGSKKPAYITKRKQAGNKKGLRIMARERIQAQ